MVSTLSNAQTLVKHEKHLYNAGVVSVSDSVSANTRDIISLEIKYAFFTNITEGGIPAIHSELGPEYKTVLYSAYKG